MTPPKDPDQGNTADISGQPPAVSHWPALVIETLRNRPDFLRAASARRQPTGGFLLQARAREDVSAVARVGFTASKKIGNAVLRNRAKRRLREVVRAVLPGHGRPGWDYVLVAKPGVTVVRDFSALLADLQNALFSLHSQKRAPAKPDPAPGRSAS